MVAAVILFSLSSGMVAMAHPAAALAQSSPAGMRHEHQPVPHVQDHSCCPRAHSSDFLAISMQLLPAGLPCRQHPCCVSQTPDAGPSLPAASGMQRPRVKESPGQVADDGAGGRYGFSPDAFGDAAFQSYSSFSTVLRI